MAHLSESFIGAMHFKCLHFANKEVSSCNANWIIHKASNVGNNSRGQPEGSLLNSYYSEV